MGTPSDEQLMSDIEILVQQSRKYTEIIHEYCTLASVRSLTQPQANRLEEILQKAQSEPWLDFFIDQADQIVADQLGLINKPFIKYQLHELKKSIDRLWCERILQEIQTQKRSEEIQQYLQDKGLYDGAIDGYIGPRTQTAIEQLKREHHVDSKTADFFDSKTRSAC